MPLLLLFDEGTESGGTITPPFSGTYIEVPSGNTVFGVSAKFKLNRTVISTRKRHRTRALHLGRAKPAYVSLISDFTTVLSGEFFKASGFSYVNRHESLHITNIIPAEEPMILSEPESFEIPIEFIEHQEDQIVTTFHDDD